MAVERLDIRPLIDRQHRCMGWRNDEEIDDVVRTRFTNPAETFRELFGRMTLNILVGNTDDHA